MNNHKNIKHNYSGNKVSKKDSKVFNNIDKARFNINDEICFLSKDGAKLICGKIIKCLKPNRQSRRSHRNDCYVVSIDGGKKSVKKSNLHRKVNCPCFRDAIKHDARFSIWRGTDYTYNYNKSVKFHNQYLTNE